MTIDPLLQTHDLSIGYTMPRRPAHVVAARINVTLNAGELVCLIGPNGAGKSTLLHTLAGMLRPLAGHVMLMGQDVHRTPPLLLARRLSIVLTERLNVGQMTAYALVALGRHPYTDWSGRLSPDDESVVQWAFEAVGAAELANRFVDELSDGECQKILIARALAQEPALMLLDEPTAYLDLPRRVETVQLLRHLACSTGRAILLSMHDLDLALRSADTIWLLPNGRPLQVGAPEDLVLSGAFEAAFRGEGVVFDMQSGTFSAHVAETGHVALHGEGIRALWARRALEREGFTVVSDDEAALARVDLAAGDAWRLTTADAVTTHHSLADLLVALKALRAATPA